MCVSYTLAHTCEYGPADSGRPAEPARLAQNFIVRAHVAKNPLDSGMPDHAACLRLRGSRPFSAISFASELTDTRDARLGVLRHVLHGSAGQSRECEPCPAQ